MVKVGNKITVIENNGGQTTTVGLIVLEYDDGLLKVRGSAGKEKVYNMRSTAFHAVEIEE